MNKLIEYIYFNSPVFIQNVFTSVYGVNLYYQRYGRQNESYIDSLRQSQWLTSDEIAIMQDDLFREMVRHAMATVPFYRVWSQNNNIYPDDINGIGDIDKLPIITKEEIRKNPDEFISDDYRKGHFTFWLSTSGTSGKALNILCDKECRRMHYSFWTRFREWHGISAKSKRATFFGRIICSPNQSEPPFWRYDAIGRNKLFSSYHLQDENLNAYYCELVRYDPVEIIGYPSSLFALGKYILEKNLSPLKPKLVITTAETLLPNQRTIIEKAFGNCVLADQYGCTEMTLFVSQCEFGSYHVNPEHGHIEVLDENGNKADYGEIITTGFLNKAMPLIRYRLGDTVRLVINQGQCRCGRSFQVVDEIVGRTDDILKTPDGKPLGRLDPIFKGMPGIYETQIIQTKLDTIEIMVVVDNKEDPTIRDSLLYEARKRIGQPMQICIYYVDEIEKEKNGKFKTVISKI